MWNNYQIFFHIYQVFLMFSTLLAKMHFHSVLDFVLLCIGLNHLTISSSYHCGGLPSSHIQSLGYHSTTPLVDLLSVNLVVCPVELLLSLLCNHVLLSALLLNYRIWWHIRRIFLFTKNLLKFPCVLYAMCRFKICDSQPKLAIWLLLIA